MGTECDSGGKFTFQVLISSVSRTAHTGQRWTIRLHREALGTTAAASAHQPSGATTPPLAMPSPHPAPLPSEEASISPCSEVPPPRPCFASSLCHALFSLVVFNRYPPLVVVDMPPSRSPPPSHHCHYPTCCQCTSVLSSRTFEVGSNPSRKLRELSREATEPRTNSLGRSQSTDSASPSVLQTCWCARL